MSRKKTALSDKRNNSAEFSNIRLQQAQETAKKVLKSGAAPKVYNLIKKTPDSWDTPPEGQQYSICEKCGKKFEQTYNGELNRYSNYRTCLDCRHKERFKKEKAIAENKVKSSESELAFVPYPWQEKAHEDFQKCRFQVLSCGNRSGKDRYTTMEGIMYFVECLNENRQIYNLDMVPPVYWWILAPTEKMAKQNWRELKKYFPKAWVVAVSDSTLTMQTVGGGIVEVRSAYDPESLVGVGLDLVTVTEAARIKDMQVVWANIEARLSSPGRGLAKDRKGNKYGTGKAIINSSPIGKNFFYEMWTWGQKNHSNYSSDWISYQLPWTCNPANEELAKTIINTKYGKITYEQSLRRRLGERLYRQNYLADFLASDGTVFKDFEEKCVINIFDSEFNFTAQQRKEYIEEWQKPVPYREYRASWDIATGSSHDTPAFVIRDMQTNRIVKILSLYGKDYETQYDTIAYWCKYYNNAPCVYSLTGHTAVKGQLAKRGVYEQPTDEQGGRKRQFVQSLVIAIQNNDLKVLYDGSDEADTLVLQMNDYTEENGKFSNKEADCDDFVSALYLNYYDYEVIVEKVPWVGLMECI